MKKLDLFAFMLCSIDCLFYIVMSGDFIVWQDSQVLYSPLVFVVGVIFPSVIAYLIAAWKFREKQPKKIWYPKHRDIDELGLYYKEEKP